MAERIHGTLAKWLADRNFGFIKPDIGDRDVSVGEAAFRASDIVPEQGERYTFEMDADRHGRPRATEIAYEGAEISARQIFNPVRP